VTLDELVAQSNYVTIHCPYNAETKGSIGRRELALMRPDTYLITTARGGIADEDALADAWRRPDAGARDRCLEH
jgi:phosphoglycerate dehydrogenase-like enzyme